jgi:DtxR family Mn-dependent transcriptional regulator
MDKDEKAEEVLETLWIRTQEEMADAVPREELESGEKEVVEGLLKEGYVAETDGKVRLTGRGLPLAQGVIRRHRLAERLLIDVLSTSDVMLDDRACKFEHVLDKGVAESICGLLGHPKVCPHGKPIPPGECCSEHRWRLHKVVSQLSQMSVGQKGKIAYVHAPQEAKLQKLMSMGILPGVPVALTQRFPSYVFQVRQEQFAVDKEIADSIYVRLVGSEGPLGPRQSEHQERRGLWQRVRRRSRGRGRHRGGRANRGRADMLD